jgi:predicted phage terminase large subunit-like protein
MDIRQLAKAAAGKLHLLTEDEKRILLQEIEELEREDAKTLAQNDFMTFVKRMWPGFIPGRHHEVIAKAFENVANGHNKRLIINLPPRHTKSEFASYLLPAWFLGKNPNKKIIQTSHTAELAVGFGRKVRNLIDSEEYNQVFTDVKLKADNKSAGRWATNKGGEYFSIGVGGSVTGKGADLLIIDDPHSEQEAKLAAHKPDIFDAVYEWYTSGPRQRLQPGGAIIIVATRWSLRDLTGQVIKASQTRGGDEWEVIELPAIMPSGKPVWPEFWKLEELLALKEELPVGKWNAQYQQQPTAEEGAIVKREWWKRWESDRPPPCDFVIQSWDTAFLKHNRADFSACTTWGVWTTEEGETNIILLDAFKDRYEFPELKQKAYETYREWEPDVFLVEAKAAGSPLVFELRRMGIPVSEYSPTKGNDKIVRLNAVSDLFASGRIWVPERKFADELIEEVAAFPSGEHDDLCLVGETMITMADGSQKRIDEIRIGEMVATPEGPCKVIDAKCTGKHETIKLNIGNTSLQITPNHPVATQRGWIPAGQINPTDGIKDTLGNLLDVTKIVSAENSLVYNLTVDRASCYFANGVLVHNCDSMTQALLRFRTGGFLNLQSDDEDREPIYRRKVAYY